MGNERTTGEPEAAGANSETKSEAKKSFDKLAGRFESLASALRARAGVASDEARAAWDRAHLDRVADDLTRTRDELKVKLHLAGLDARDALDQVERRAVRLQEKAAAGADRLSDELAERLERLARELRAGEHR